MVECQICGKEMKAVNALHLRVHNLGLPAYLEAYPDAVLFSEEVRQSMSVASQLAWQRDPSRVCFLVEYSKTHPHPLLGTTHIGYTKGKKLNLTPEGHDSLVAHGRRIGVSNKGRKGTEEMKRKQSAALIGRSYEDLMGKEKADALKEDRRRCFNWVTERGLRQEVATRGSMKNKELMRTDAEYRERYCQMRKRMWAEASPATRNRWIRRVMQGNNIRPNKPETYMITLLNFVFPAEWKYVGDGSVVIAGKCPDFINVNGQKKIIELYGDFWHRGQNPQDRMDIFAQYGYDTLIVWEHELKNIQKLSKKLVAFGGEKN